MFKLKEQPNSSLPAALEARFRDADGPALKTALFLLCENRPLSENEIISSLGLPAETAARSLSFWENAGLIVKTNGEGEAGVSVKKAADAPKVINLRAPLTPDRISEISLRNPEIAMLMQETQTILGRPLDSNESRLLLEIFEYDRFPADVILSLVGFCAPRAKNGRRVIGDASRLAEELAAEGIDTCESVNERIRLLELREKREREVASALELADKSLSRSEKTHVARWFEEYGYDVAFVKEAALRANGNTKISYIGGILKSWYNNGYKSIKDTREEISNTTVPVTKTRERGEDSLIKRAVNKRREKETV